jgi:hypothetical protein
MTIHECPRFLELNPEPHFGTETRYGYGLALDGDVFLGRDGKFGMGNGEYVVYVAFCPYCGVPLVDEARRVLSEKEEK